MALSLNLKLDLKTVPGYARIIIAVLPAIIVAAAVIIIFIMPRQKEIKALDVRIGEQNNKIAENQAKVAKLDVLIRENEKLLGRLKELKELLPEEKEISGLLKQFSDMSIAAGLEIKSWRPRPKTMHSSGIVYEIPSDFVVGGTYHDLGNFLASLTKLNRIVNVTTLRLGGAQKGKAPAQTNLNITFSLSTFSAVAEADIGKKPEGKK
ncbi:MAG: type 4a pilus biogenesis protein PilO [Nitrospirae bacterium]|nr:type 4a pilus biogenesis protein PilO [Nitrospirota bacterium]